SQRVVIRYPFWFAIGGNEQFVDSCQVGGWRGGSSHSLFLSRWCCHVQVFYLFWLQCTRRIARGRRGGRPKALTSKTVQCEQLVAKKWSLPSSPLVVKLIANSRKAVQKGVDAMSTEENKALARRIFEEAGSQGNYAVIDEAIAPTFVYRA